MFFNVLLYVFFFFKQKTAYEMRISDWSSDVCSSDLGIGLRVLLEIAVEIIKPTDDVQMARLIGQLQFLREIIIVLLRHIIEDWCLRPVEVERAEIGRASCRERVCQYV